MQTRIYNTVRLMSGSRSARTANVDVDNQNEVFVEGFRFSFWRAFLVCTACVLSCGLLILLFYWRRDWLLRYTHTACPVFLADRLLIRDKFLKSRVEFLKVLKFDKRSNLICQRFDSSCDIKRLEMSFPFGNLGNAAWIIQHIKTKGSVVFFTFKKIRYFWHADLNEFQQISGLDEDTSIASLHESKSLSNDEARFRARLFGSNSIIIHIPNIAVIIIKEALSPIYLFQLCSVVLWYYMAYYIYASAIIVMALFSLTMTVYETRKARLNMRRMIVSESKQSMKVFRENAYVDLNCKYLVPGDIILIEPEGQSMPCDAVLIEGVCIVDESMLTGVSVPEMKTALSQTDGNLSAFSVKTHINSALLRGTQVLQARSAYGSNSEDRLVRAVVIRIGWETCKGALMQTLLYPKSHDFRFQRDSLKFVAIMAILALAGMIYSIIIHNQMKTSITELIVSSLDILTAAVPPVLPAAMTFVMFFSLRRLKLSHIFCISPSSINMSGDIDTVVFDKTGTLTEEGVVITCAIPAYGGKFGKKIEVWKDKLFNFPIIHGMAACHSLNLIRGHMFGDPVDTAMFNFTTWILIDTLSTEAFIVRPASSTSSMLTRNMEIAIVRTYPFDSILQKQSTIIKYKGETNFSLFVKGSPDKICSLCRKETLPTDLNDKILFYAKKGDRLYALASGNLNLNEQQIYKVPSEELEHDLTFVGLIVCENKIKDETPAVISHLRRAQIRPVLATGDNLLMALSVARRANFFDSSVPIYLVEWHDEEQRPIFSSMDESSALMTNYFQHESVAQDINLEQIDLIHRDIIYQKSDVSLERQMKSGGFSQRYYLAMTGLTWEEMRQNAPHLLERFALMGLIFARMLPHQKAQIIETLQSIECNVAMCGNGLSDCEALRVANTGLSLSRFESSVACAFAAQKGNISAILDVIREGRCALITSYGMFQFMAAYGMIQFICCLILYWLGTNLTHYGSLYIDLVIVIPLILTFGLSKANPVLEACRPQINLLSAFNLIYLLFHSLLAFATMISALYLVRSQSWFQPFVMRNDTSFQESFFNETSFEETAIYIVVVFQFIVVAVVFAPGRPFRQSLLTNYLFIANVVVITVVTFGLLVETEYSVLDFFKVRYTPSLTFRFYLFIIAFGHAFVSLALHFLMNRSDLFTCLRKMKARKFEVILKKIEFDSEWPPIEDYDTLRTTKVHSALKNWDSVFHEFEEVEDTL